MVRHVHIWISGCRPCKIGEICLPKDRILRRIREFIMLRFSHNTPNIEENPLMWPTPTKQETIVTCSNKNPEQVAWDYFEIEAKLLSEGQIWGVGVFVILGNYTCNRNISVLIYYCFVHQMMNSQDFSGFISM